MCYSVVVVRELTGVCVCVWVLQIGQFFGVIDPILMTDLVNVSLFTLNKTYDYQSVCDPERESKADAGLRSVYVVSYTDQISHTLTHTHTHTLTHTHTHTHPHTHPHTHAHTHPHTHTP